MSGATGAMVGKQLYLLLITPLVSLAQIRGSHAHLMQMYSKAPSVRPIT